MVSDAGVLRLYQANLEVGRETFIETGTRLETSVVIPLARLRIVSVVERDSLGRAQRLEERIMAFPADTLLRTYTAARDGDSMRISLASRSGTPRHWAKAGTVDEIAPDQTISPFIRLVRQSNRTARTWKVWLPNADNVLDVAVTFRGDTARLQLETQTMYFQLAADGSVRGLTVPQAQARYERHTAGELPPLPGVNRPAPDYGAPAGAAFTATEVRVPVTGLRGDTFSLGCTFTRPTSGGSRVPAAITLTGSGSQDRDESLWPLIDGYRLFGEIAERLAAFGVAVLRCDDYGFGASGGPVDSATSMLDFAGAARAQLAWLRARDDVNGARLAIIGHSEGGIVGPMVAAEDPQLRALVIMAGPGKGMGAILHDQFLYQVERMEGLTPEQRAEARTQALREADAFGGASGYIRHARGHDPVAAARRVRTPTLILQGMLDRQITHGQADTLAAAMRAAGNRDVTTRKFERLNHLFLVSPSGTGAPAEYATLTDIRIPREVLDALAAWLGSRLR